MSLNNPHEGHRERLKRRFLESGINALEDHEALELLLFYAVPYKNTNPLAHDLINRFGSFHAVFDASVNEICKVDGMTEHRAVLLKLVHSIECKYLQSMQKNIRFIDGTESAGEYLKSRFYGLKIEHFVTVYLDNSGKILKCSTISEGCINVSPVNIRKILEDVVATDATSVILSHNHPGGIPKPSPDDIDMTKRIINSLQPFNVSVLDHIIVADNKYISLADTPGYSVLF